MNIHHGGEAFGQAHPNARNQAVQPAGIKPASNVNMLEIAGSTSRIPLAWGPHCETTYPFREYVKDLIYWTMGTDVEPHRQASLVIQRLSGPAKAKAEAMFGLDADLIAWGGSQQRSWRRTRTTSYWRSCHSHSGCTGSLRRVHTRDISQDSHGSVTFYQMEFRISGYSHHAI